MTDTIIVSLDLFDRESQLNVVKNGQINSYSIPTNMIESNIVAKAKETGIYNIKINAPSIFVNEIARRIRELEMTSYSENKISIEGI